MELVYFTIAAIVLYVVSDFILNSIEIRMGKRLPSRSFIFLVIITILALLSFNFIQAIFAPLDTVQPKTPVQTEQTFKDHNSATQTQSLPADKETQH